MNQPLTTALISSQSKQAKSVLGQQKALRRLGPRHKLIISLHLEGKRGSEIARIIGCSQNMVYATLKDPSVQTVIAHFNEGFDFDIKALYPRAIEAVAKALEDPDRAMQAVDRFMKLSGRDKPAPSTENNINVTNNIRLKLVTQLKEAVESNLIDLKPFQVSEVEEEPVEVEEASEEEIVE